ncbi:MAG: hypothetical protein Q8R76_01720 [Candidatus Omnitrophota bacterium]|nr:hypothetical protein [Candidatus Omnitrophota bacterium]
MSKTLNRCLYLVISGVLLSNPVWAEVEAIPASWQQITVSLERSQLRAGRIQKKSREALAICDEILEEIDQLQVWSRRYTRKKSP